MPGESIVRSVRAVALAAMLLGTDAAANEKTRAAERLAEAFNAGAGFAELFAPEIQALRDADALEAWRGRMRAEYGTLRTTRYGRYLGQGQHIYSAEFDGGQLDLYLALDRQGRIVGLMLCGEGLMPLARPEDLRRCLSP